jgi:K+-sensing histidine kinase KdpD
MVAPLATVLVIASLLLATWAGVLAALDRLPGRGLLRALIGLQLLMLVQAGVVVARMLGGERPASVGALVGYLLVSVLVVPLGTYWSLEERTRYSTLVLVVACLTVAVLVQRLLTLWSTVA